MIDIHCRLISEELQIPANRVRQTILLLEDGATIPFIARYRKEQTGSLDEVQIGDIHQRLQRLKELEKRRETVLSTIEEQGKLTPELRQRILSCYDPVELEDIYLPYKPKRKTRATAAREKGLEPLALLIFQQKTDPERAAPAYLSEEVPTVEDALQGARDIIAEWINEDEKARQRVRFAFGKSAVIRSKVARGKDEEGAKYRDYFEFQEPLRQCPSHRMLAMRRGEEEGFLRLSIEPEDSDDLQYRLESLFIQRPSPAADQVRQALQDAYSRLLAPSIETEFRQSSKEKADEEAINVFTLNLKQLLLSPPLGFKRILGIDPGFRTGCKVVVLEENGDLLQNTTIYPHPPQSDAQQALATLDHLVNTFHISAIAVGNGTAGKETIHLLQKAPFAHMVDIFMVNESGASIYSASPLAREEFPDQDITVRGAVSIGRRLMDPLAELVKIDPKSIGVGQYQHDVNQTRLRESLDRVVESCVNAVGVQLNTASKHLLTYISGLGPALAQNIVQYRTEKGAFRTRDELKKVPRMGEKAFEQCAGFLRVRQSTNPLDNTAVHPERYALVNQIAKDLGCTLADLVGNPALQKQIDPKKYLSESVGLPTLQDILRELAKPGLDPRGAAKPFEFSNEVQSMEDLREGMVLPGIVTNITNFGAFVDIGVKQDGLVHVSQMANRFVKNPADVVSLQQEVRVKVLEVDLARKRITLSMKVE